MWRTPSQLSAGRGSYHRHCYAAWRQTLPQQEKSHALGTVGWIRSRIRASGDAGLIARLEHQIDSQIAHLVNPQREGRPATLLADKERALLAAELHDRRGLTGREIGALFGLTLARDGRGNKSTPRSVQELIRFGRALRRRREPERARVLRKKLREGSSPSFLRSTRVFCVVTTGFCGGNTRRMSPTARSAPASVRQPKSRPDRWLFGGF